MPDSNANSPIETIAADGSLEAEYRRWLPMFINTSAHELRTPLSVINTSLYLLRMIKDPIKQEERLQIVEHQVAQMARLVDQMQILARVESLNNASSPTPVSLNKVLIKLEQDYAPVLTKKKLTFELSFDDNLPDIDVDFGLLVVALENVLENAIAYTDEGRIKASTTTHNNAVIVIIEDTGIGIDAQDLPHIFEQFYKVEKQKGHYSIAAGLGLAITQRIMALSGGRIEVESQLGQGSTFRLIWPMKP